MPNRVEMCRQRAKECERAAARIADPQVQACYSKMACQWREMAERQLAIDEALAGIGHRLVIAHRCYGQPHKKEEEAPERSVTAQLRDGLGCSDLALSVPFRARASHIMQFRLVSVEHSSPKLSYDFRNFAEHGLAPIFLVGL
jgi:hypothetical protein